MDDEATRFPLAWPPAWPRTISRKHSAFSKRERSYSAPGAASYARTESLSVGDGLRRLNDELRRLGARRIVISSNLRLRTDGLPVASQSKMLADPGVAVYFKLKDQPRVLACDRWFSAADNMAAIAGHIAAIRTQERYGVGTLEQAFAGYAALPAVGESGGGNWRIELELAEVPIHQITAAVVEERYRALAKQRHPDLPGGSHEAMARLSTAVQSARRYFEVQR